MCGEFFCLLIIRGVTVPAKLFRLNRDRRRLEVSLRLVTAYQVDLNKLLVFCTGTLSAFLGFNFCAIADINLMLAVVV